jgi:hypothetical protein
MIVQAIPRRPTCLACKRQKISVANMGFWNMNSAPPVGLLVISDDWAIVNFNPCIWYSINCTQQQACCSQMKQFLHVFSHSNSTIPLQQLSSSASACMPTILWCVSGHASRYWSHLMQLNLRETLYHITRKASPPVRQSKLIRYTLSAIYRAELQYWKHCYQLQ